MKIVIADKYLLTADQYQYIVKEKKIVKDGKNAGEEYLSLVGYFPKLSQAISGLINLDVQMSEVTSLKEMQNHIETIAAQCEAAFCGSVNK